MFIDAPWYRPEENLAFTGYMAELDRLDGIADRINNGDYNFTVDFDLTEDDYRYIEAKTGVYLKR